MDIHIILLQQLNIDHVVHNKIQNKLYEFVMLSFKESIKCVYYN